MTPPPSSAAKAARTAAASGAILSIGAALVGPVAPAGADVDNLAVANNADSGAGSLRQAILDTNDGDAPGEVDTITIPAGLGPITLTTGELTVDEPLVITGAGASAVTIASDGSSRIFYLGTDGAVTISGVTLTGGSETDGGAIYSSGADLTIQSSVITGNDATDGGGGGLYASSGDFVRIVDTTFSGNTATGRGGGAVVHLDDDELTVTGSTFSGNTAGDYGGGLVSVHVYDVTIDRTTFSGNTAGDNGGGFHGHAHEYAETSETPTSLTISSSTFSGNTAAFYGGGVFAEYFSDVTIEHSTIVGNDASDSGGGVFLYNVYDSATIDHTIIANNTGGDEADLGVYVGDGVVADVSFSLIESEPDASMINDAGGNIFGQDPMVGPLASNGGNTQTHALLAGSPAINTGDAAFAPPPATDQRGLARVQGGRIDIGAFEVQDPTPEPTPTTETPRTDPPAAQPVVATPTFTG